MPFIYDCPPENGPLRQGEVLSNIYEHRPIFAPIKLEQIDVDEYCHRYMVILSPDCDLEQDFNSRFHDERDNVNPDPVAREIEEPHRLPYVLLCDVYERDQIRPRFTGMKDVWRRLEKNQDERYHHFAEAPLSGTDPPVMLPGFYLDFKKILTLATQRLYEAIGAGVKREAVVPPIYLHDLVHRFYSFHSRVGIPD